MKRTVFLLLFAVLIRLTAAEQPALRIATVDLDRVFREYYRTQAAEANLKRQAELYKEHAVKLEEHLKRIQAEFISLRDAALSVVLTDVARESKRLAAQEKYRMYQLAQKELADFNREKQGQLRDERDRSRAEIYAEISKTVKNAAVLGGYQLVLDRSALSVTSLPTVIYSAPTLDLTDTVLRVLNTGHPNAKSSAGKKPANPAQPLNK